MKQILIELDDETMARLEQVAPARSRRRSEFIRDALRSALWDLEERATAAAYARVPDSASDAYFDPGVWEAPPAAPRRTNSRNTKHTKNTKKHSR
jgi:predicted DNA-binding protein